MKMIPTTGGAYLTLYGFNKKGELIFRSSYNFKHLQYEKPIIDSGICYLNLYYFSAEYLKELPNNL